jgi:Kef-type K+ transport system membrane component KefB
VSFAIWQVAANFHLEALLIALTAGFWVENFADEGEGLIHGIEKVSLPVYALFFAAAGAKVDLGALASMWPLALLLAGSRAVLIWLGTRLGAKMARSEPEVRRYAWFGFISQAGVTLALSSIVARAFPTWGVEIQVIIIAMIGLHELIGPIGFQYALRRAGEINAGSDRERRGSD